MPGLQFTIGEPSATKRRFPFFLVDDGDGSTPEDGEVNGQPQISVNGGSFSNTAETLTFISNGAYYIGLSVGEVNTPGRIHIRYKSANTREFQLTAEILPGGDTSIDDLQSQILRLLRNTNQIKQQLIARNDAVLQDIEHDEFI